MGYKFRKQRRNIVFPPDKRQRQLNSSTRPIRFYPNVIVALTVTDWTKHLAVET